MKTKKNPSLPSPPPSFTSLPDDVIITCLARIPRSYYRTLSSVCKSFRSLLTSKELDAARARLGITQQCLYVCQWDRSRQFSQWFTLWINPNRALTTKNKKKTIGKLWTWKLYSNPYSVSKPITVGSEIYIIGGNGSRSSEVRVLDCRSHTWRDAPSMNVARNCAATCLYEGKIYVTQEMIIADEEESFAEVFDTKIQTWERLPDPSKHVKDNNVLYIIEEIEGKIHFGSFEGMIEMEGRHAMSMYAYDPNQHEWECFETKDSNHPNENVLMWWNFTDYGRWYDKDIKKWKVVSFGESLDEIHKRKDGVIRSGYSAVVGFNGNLLVFWDEQVKPSLFSWVHVTRNYQMSTWCAEISLEECDRGEIRGKVEWVDMLHTLPVSSHISHRLLVSI